MDAKEFGDAWLEGQEAQSKRQYEIEMKNLDVQKDQFFTDRFLLVLFVSAVIVLSVLQLLEPEVLAFLMLLIGYFVKFQPIKNVFTKSDNK